MGRPRKSHKYIMIPAEKSHCPSNPDHKIVLLCREDQPPRSNDFYICFDCRRIFQIGVGEVFDWKKGK